MAWKPNYIEEETLASYARGSLTVSQEHLATVCASASRVVDRVTGRQFGITDTPEARFYRARYSASECMWFVETDDFQSTDDMVIEFDSAGDGTYATSVAVSGVIPHLPNAIERGKAWEGFFLRASVAAGVDGRLAGFRVLNTWGWSAFPPTVIDATKLQGSRVLARRDAPFGVAGSPDNGSELRLLAKADPDVIVMLKDYARRAWVR